MTYYNIVTYATVVKFLRVILVVLVYILKKENLTQKEVFWSLRK